MEHVPQSVKHVVRSVKHIVRSVDHVLGPIACAVQIVEHVLLRTVEHVLTIEHTSDLNMRSGMQLVAKTKVNNHGSERAK